MTAGVSVHSWSCEVLLALAALASPAVLAQSFCSSDGQPAPTALLERFISADCEACWAARAPAPGRGELALDWIVQGARGDDAPLSAAATRDAASRLAALRRPVPPAAEASRRRVDSARRGLRVSHGIPFNGYVGASIELRSPQPGRWSAWLLLVETIAPGAEGTSIERNLVRNVLQRDWDRDSTGAREVTSRLFESRPISIPAGAKPERLRVVGWVEDERGRIRAIAQSRCAPPAPGG